MTPFLFKMPGTSTTILSGTLSINFLFGILTASSSILLSSIIASMIGTILSFISLLFLSKKEE